MSNEMDLRKLLYAVLTIFVMAITLGVVSNLRQNAAAERTRNVVCGIVQEAATDRAGQLAAYEQEPPTTPAGQAQREAVERALVRWQGRAERLGCND